MPLLHLYDRAGLLAAPSLTPDPDLATYLAGRVRRLAADGLLDMTEIVVVDAGTTEADVVEAVGWWPLRDADGRRHGEPGFVQPFELVFRATARHLVGVQPVGNSGFAFEVVVAEDACPDLVALIRGQAT